MKSGNLNFMEPSVPLQACNGTDLPFLYRSGDGVEGVRHRAMSWTLRGVNPGSGKKVLSSSKRPYRLWLSPSLRFTGCLGSFMRLMRPGCEAYHPSPFGAEVTNKWSCTPAPSIYLNGVSRKKLYLVLTFDPATQFPSFPRRRCESSDF